MATVVLVGLIFMICEMYIDDCSVFGDNNIEFVSRLWSVFGKEKVFHVSDMKPFVFDPTVVDPLDIARRDHMEYFIDKILDHRGNIKKRSILQFHVNWLGYTQESNTWEP